MKPRVTTTIISASRILRPPSLPQDPRRQRYELPLSEARSLLLTTFNGTPIVQIVKRQPQTNNPGSHRPSPINRLVSSLAALLSWRATLKKAVSFLTESAARTRSVARLTISLTPFHSHARNSKARQTHLEATTGFGAPPRHRRLPMP